jgi:hypothetical protein
MQWDGGGGSGELPCHKINGAGVGGERTGR